MGLRQPLLTSEADHGIALSPSLQKVILSHVIQCHYPSPQDALSSW